MLYPGIEEAYYGLKNVSTRYKHIMILTDAGVEDAAYERLMRRIAEDRINVSTVQVGGQGSQVMIDMAGWGRGRFYSASDLYELPEAILKQPSTMKLPAYKTGVFEVASRGGEGWWTNINRDGLPALSGYVETRSRPGAEVLIEVQASAHPVLASWHYGLGRVTALMTEPVGEGTEGWQGWSDYGRMLARVVSRTADDSRPFRYSIARKDHLIEVRALRNENAMGLKPHATDDGCAWNAGGRGT